MHLYLPAQGNSTAFPPGWNHLAKSPPMGWRSWNAFGANINDKTFRDANDAVTAKVWNVGGAKASLIEVGYTRVGIDDALVTLLGDCSPVPVTYAGGAAALADLDRVKALGRGRVDLTIGSALDVFGGDIPYADVLAWQEREDAS